MLSIRYEWPKGRRKGKEFFISHGKYMYYDSYPQTPEEIEEEKRYSMEMEIEEFEDELKDGEELIGEAPKGATASGINYGKPEDDQREFNKIRRNQGVMEYPTSESINFNLLGFTPYRNYDPNRPGEWKEAYSDYEEYEHPIGTALLDFINFDIDIHINGGREVEWSCDDFGSYVSGWVKDIVCYPKECKEDRERIVRILTRLDPLFYLDSLTVNELKTQPPLFLKMYPHIYYDFENWEYRQDGITYIKDLQKRIKYAVEKTFMPENGSDKRTALERYNDNKVTPLAPLTEETVKKYANTEWETINSLEYALSVEFYAMMYCDIMVIICDNCGLYSIPKKKDRRTRYCSRKYYTTIFREFSRKNGRKMLVPFTYAYSCMEDGITAGQHKNDTNDIITYTIMLDRERLRKFCSNACKIKNEKFRDIVIGSYDRLVCVLENVIEENEAEFRKRLDKLQDQNERASLGCEFTKLIDDAMNNEIKQIFRESRIERLAEKDIEDSFTLNYKKRIKKYIEKFK